MFGSKDVYAMVNGFRVRVKDARQKDRNHLAEVDFEIALTHALAEEIDPVMARDLYEKKAGEHQPKPEISEAVFNSIVPDVQLVTIREHPDLDTFIARIPGVAIRKINFYKGDGNALLMGFTGTWTLGDYEREAIALIKRLKSGVYMSCETQEPQLVEQADLAPEGQGTEADVDKSGNVTNIRKGRRRRTPAAATSDTDQAPLGDAQPAE